MHITAVRIFVCGLLIGYSTGSVVVHDPPLEDDEMWQQVRDIPRKCAHCTVEYGNIMRLDRMNLKEFIGTPDAATAVLWWVDVEPKGQLALDWLKSETFMKIGAVGCHDWTDVCQKFNITEWPMLHLCPAGAHCMSACKRYMGGWSADSIRRWLVDGGMQMHHTDEQYPSITADTLPSLLSSSQPLLIGLYDSNAAMAKKAVTDALTQLHTHKHRKCLLDVRSTLGMQVLDDWHIDSRERTGAIVFCHVEGTVYHEDDMSKAQALIDNPDRAYVPRTLPQLTQPEHILEYDHLMLMHGVKSVPVKTKAAVPNGNTKMHGEL